MLLCRRTAADSKVARQGGKQHQRLFVRASKKRRNPTDIYRAILWLRTLSRKVDGKAAVAKAVQLTANAASGLTR